MLLSLLCANFPVVKDATAKHIKAKTTFQTINIFIILSSIPSSFHLNRGLLQDS